MSNTPLMELNEEIRRLYIAGSDLAAGDYRLKRLLPVLQQMGQRAPIFMKLSEGVAELIEPASNNPQSDSAKRLQDVNLLLQSILRTQGEGASEGETASLVTNPMPLRTFLSYRKLSAVRTALTTRGGGRYEIIYEAYQSGYFQDLRLVPLAIQALSDPYTEIADLAMDRILPAYGPAIVPHLLDSFHAEGGRLEARKLTVVAKCGGKEVLTAIYEAAVSGSDEVRTTAIHLLAGHKEYEEALLDWSRDKKKGIREAAYAALAESGWESAVERLYEASQGKDSELVNPSLSRCQSPLLTRMLAQDFAKLLKSQQEIPPLSDKQKTTDNAAQIKRYLWSLHLKESPELEALYLEVLRRYEWYMFKLDWSYLANEAIRYVSRTGTAEGRRLVEEALELDFARSANTVHFTCEIFVKAQPILSPQRLYEVYANVLEQGTGASALSGSKKNCKRLLGTIEGLVVSRTYKRLAQDWARGEEVYVYDVEMPSPESIAASWDSRWLDHFILLDHLALVSAFARPGHEGAISFLLDRLKNSPEFRNRFANLAVIGLVRAGIPEHDLHEALVSAMEDERNTECHEIELFLFGQLCCLPARYAERIRAVLPKFKGRAEEQLTSILNSQN